MKKAFLFVFMATAFVVMTQAQESSPLEKQSSENSRHAKKKLKDDLNLSKDQSQQLKEINNDYKARMQDLKNNESLKDDQKKEQMSKLHQERNTKIVSILTPEQKTKMEQRKKALNHRKNKKEKTPA